MEITTSWLQWPCLNYGYLSECGWLNANSFFLVKSFGGEYEHKYVTEKQNSCFMKQDGDLVTTGWKNQPLQIHFYSFAGLFFPTFVI